MVRDGGASGRRRGAPAARRERWRAAAGDNAKTRFPAQFRLGSGPRGSAREGEPNCGVEREKRRPAARGGGDLRCAPSGHGRHGGEGKGGRPSILTTTRCSRRVCSTAGSDGTAARRAPELGNGGGGAALGG
jgi:hypothetical protein